jgi:hypothetical protein
VVRVEPVDIDGPNVCATKRAASSQVHELENAGGDHQEQGSPPPSSREEIAGRAARKNSSWQVDALSCIGRWVPNSILRWIHTVISQRLMRKAPPASFAKRYSIQRSDLFKTTDMLVPTLAKSEMSNEGSEPSGAGPMTGPVGSGFFGVGMLQGRLTVR